jgi:hypothetical protein
MGKTEKLLEKARASANNFRFDDLCKLAESFGWVMTRQDGSHCMFENEDLDVASGHLMTFQNRKGKAVPYQVKQLLAAIDNLESNAK